METKKSGTSIAQFSSVTESCLTLCDPMDWSTPGFPIPEFNQTHVGDAIQTSYYLIILLNKIK